MSETVNTDQGTLPSAEDTDASVPNAATPEGDVAKPSKRPPALSPSRANDFRKCPLSFRFKYVDKTPEPPSLVKERGTLVHSVLEHLFNLPRDERTLAKAYELIGPRWSEQKEKMPAIQEMFVEENSEANFLIDIRSYLDNYFRLEFPERLEPYAREQFIEAVTDSGIRLRGIADRIDRAPNGALRVIDYKTGKTPLPQFSDDYVFQMKFYALMLMLRDGTIPARLQLLFLRDKGSLHIDPTPADINQFIERLESEWCAIENAANAQYFPPKPSRLCEWCSFQHLCPEYGGVTPPVNETGLIELLKIRQNPCS